MSLSAPGCEGREKNLSVRIGRSEIPAEEAYFGPKLPTAIGGTVLVGNYLYGSGQSTVLCVEFKTGRIIWNERSIAPASICYADGLLYLHGEEVTWRSLKRCRKHTGNEAVHAAEPTEAWQHDGKSLAYP